ncbi:hypothetical protein ACIA8O_26070 [Kitasatospora sp. NPDC051853]|uniref:hypothetical protein n=1 Tax=Kitasatospora sp. NPDC051853 TaxID=3364058 RepID=UPI00379700AC
MNVRQYPVLPRCNECDDLTARANEARARGGHYALRKAREDKAVHARAGMCPKVPALRARMAGAG